MEVRSGKTLIRTVLGDITTQETEAIVNAANSGLLGVEVLTALSHRAGGPRSRRKEIRARQEVAPRVRQ